ncbi:hypothetical protein Scep_016237 [Stephania cephalantha]|uniref:CASP-like protein n=1 Tax=Stephania cephalantha TaxID=152367 RepID=A0AAP0IM92_9MAGN
MAPPTSSPSLALPITNLVFRILTFIFLIASAIIVGINSMKAIVDDEIIITANIKIVNAHKYGVATCVLGMAYALFQIPFSIYHVSSRKPMVVSDGLPLFTMFGDQVISYLLATGAAAIYGVSVDPKKFVDGLDDLLEQYGSGDISTLRSKYDHFTNIAIIGASVLLLGFLCAATCTILSVFSIISKKKIVTTEPPKVLEPNIE